MKTLLSKFHQLADSYFSESSSVLRSKGVPSDLKIPFEGLGEEKLFKDMHSYLASTPRTLSPQFQNQLFSGLQSYALLGEWLATLTNSTMATYEVAPFATKVERELVSFLAQLIGWKEHDGIMVTGGSNANLVAILMARNLKHPQTKIHGNGDNKFSVFVSEDAHYSFDKAANIMGLGSQRVIKIPATHQGVMRFELLEEAITLSRLRGEIPLMIAATAGTTVLGNYDDLQALSTIAKKENLWLHVDGAWGGSVLMSKTHRSLLKGIELADSMTWDTHKMLATGLMSSFFLTSHPGALLRSHAGGGSEYIFHAGDEIDLGPSSLQCGRRNDALKVWFAFRSLGVSGLERYVDQLMGKAQATTRLIAERAEFELIHDPVMLNICFRLKGEGDRNLLHRRIRERLIEEGEFFVNLATRRGDTFFRLIMANPETTLEHSNLLLNKLISIGEDLQ